MYRLTQRCSLQRAPLSLKKSSVREGLVSASELEELCRLLGESLDAEASKRVHNVTLIAVNHVPALCRTLGRSPRTEALLRGLAVSLPRLWEIEAEREADAEQNEINLALEDEYEDELELETSIEAELHSGFASFKDDADDDEKVQTYKLSPVPPSLVAEFKAYSDYRLEPLNRMRDGSCVVELTASSDVATCTRFLGWLHATQPDVPLGLESTTGHEKLGEWAEAWVKMLREDRSLKYSSIANYVNGLFNITNYCYTALTPSEAALALDVPSTEQLLRMRAQAEKLAKQDALFARKDPNWIDWPQLQAGRIKCLAAWDANRKKPYAERQKLLREVLVMLFFSVQPPDRVGIIRRLRFHQSVRTNGEGFDMDLSNMRFKNSKFYGPTVTSISPLITPYLKLYLQMLEFDAVGGDPYLFSPAGDDQRAMTSSQWSQFAKGIVKRWTGIAAPPKTMRASFITYMKDHTECPKILAAAARAMKHKGETQSSDHYDKAQNDRLVAAAVKFAEDIAKQHDEQAGVTHAPPNEWTLVAGQLPEYTFHSEQAEPGDDGKRPFKCVLEWVDGVFAPGARLRFPTVVGLPHGLEFTLPDDDAIVGKALSVTARVDPVAVQRKSSFKVTSLQMYSAPEEDEEPVEQSEEEAAAAAAAQAAQARRDAGEGRDPVASHQLPPRDEGQTLGELKELGFSLHAAARTGDCWPLSVLASANKITTAEAGAPTPLTDGKVEAARKQGIDLVSAARIGGVDGNEVRRQELGLKVTPAAAAKQLAPWKALRKWRTAPGDETLASAFQFGVAACVRPTVVLERGTTPGTLLDPCRAYAMMDGGALRRSPAAPSKPVTIPFWFELPFADLKERLAADPMAFSVVLFDRSECHYSPLVRPEDVAPTELVDAADVGNLDDADDALAEMGAAPPSDEVVGGSLEEEEMEADAEVAALDDAAIAQRMAALELRWKDEKQEVMYGTALSYDRIGGVDALLEMMGVDALTLHVPGFTFDFERSVFGRKRLHCTSRPSNVLVSEGLVGDGDESPPPPPPPPVEPAVEVPAAEVPGASDAMPGPVTLAAVAAAPPVVTASEAIAEQPAPTAQPVAVAAVPPVAAAAAPVAAVAVAAVIVAAPAPAVAPTASGKRKQRAAAKRAVAAIGAEEEVDEPTPKKVVKTVATPPASMQEATLPQALAARFARFEPVADPPDWLGAALEPDSPSAKALHGALICYRWESWGWCVARLGQTADRRCNFSAVYSNEWREDHTLTPESYSSTGAHGSWALLQPTRAASPIVGYSGGKYKKVVNGAPAWLRASADGLLHHTREELEQARLDAAAAAAQEREAAVDNELDASAFEVGDKVWAKGRAPGSGEMEFYEAVVLGKRKRFPPLKVLYVKTADGQTDPLCLPTPQNSHVAAAHVRTARPE